MKLIRFSAALVIAHACFVTLACAQASHSAITIPYGAWIHDALGIARDVALAVVPLFIAWLSRELPPYAAFMLRTKIAEQWLGRAIDGAYNAVDGATRDRLLTVELGNAVLARALQDMIDNAPAWLVTWLGGEAGIRRAILRRLDLEAKAAISPSS
jgi:hypothetical protein